MGPLASEKCSLMKRPRLWEFRVHVERETRQWAKMSVVWINGEDWRKGAAVVREQNIWWGKWEEGRVRDKQLHEMGEMKAREQIKLDWNIKMYEHESKSTAINTSAVWRLPLVLYLVWLHFTVCAHSVHWAQHGDKIYIKAFTESWNIASAELRYLSQHEGENEQNTCHLFGLHTGHCLWFIYLLIFTFYFFFGHAAVGLWEAYCRHNYKHYQITSLLFFFALLMECVSDRWIHLMFFICLWSHTLFDTSMFVSFICS